MKPLNAAARARLSYPTEPHACSYSSSGSEHDPLSYLVHAFLENEYDVGKSTVPPTTGDDSDSDSDSGSCSIGRAIQVAEEIEGLLKPKNGHEPFCQQLFSDVEETVEALASLEPNRSCFNRAVMRRLREKGYDCGLCKARWEGSKGLAAGNYEYIDVVPVAEDGKKERYVVDIGFKAEFEVAGPTNEYQTVLSALPQVALARTEEKMKRVLRIIADEAKRSLKRRGLSVPPWRKKRFLMAKWLGPYRRTTNPILASVGAPAGSDVNCTCAVGFAVPQLPATNACMIGDET